MTLSRILALSLTAGCLGLTTACQYAASGTTTKSGATAPAAARGPLDKPGFVTEIEDGRLWVFRTGKIEKSDKHTTLIGAGPGGMTIKAPDKATALEYLAAKEGFQVQAEDGRLWIFRAGAEIEKSEKHVTVVGAGPRGMTIKALDKATAQAYLTAPPRTHGPRAVRHAGAPRTVAAQAAPSKPSLRAADFRKPGFEVVLEDGRLWVFQAGAPHAKSDKHATLVGVGPMGLTLKSPDRDTALAYLATRPGFTVEIEDGRLWVFREGQPREKSDKHYTLVGAGPMGLTLKALDKETAKAYLAAKTVPRAPAA